MPEPPEREQNSVGFNTYLVRRSGSERLKLLSREPCASSRLDRFVLFAVSDLVLFGVCTHRLMRVGFSQRDGKFFAQRFRSTLPVLDNGCKQGAFFHMQEWKKIWGYGTHGVDPLELALARKAPPTFTVTTEGITLLT
eukprot:6184579-Pleurochrysis_carterae.AAC.2